MQTWGVLTADTESHKLCLKWEVNNVLIMHAYLHSQYIYLFFAGSKRFTVDISRERVIVKGELRFRYTSTRINDVTKKKSATFNIILRFLIKSFAFCINGVIRDRLSDGLNIN